MTMRFRFRPWPDSATPSPLCATFTKRLPDLVGTQQHSFTLLSCTCMICQGEDASNMPTIETRAQRALVVAILFVSSLQFFLGHTEKKNTAIHPFYTSSNRANSSISVSTAITKNGTDAHAALSFEKKDTSAAKDISANDFTNVRESNTSNFVFCGTCLFDLKNTCNARLEYITKKYKTPLSEAKESIMSKCKIDYDREPYVVLHAGPHKTGTTSIQSFLYESFLYEYLQKDRLAIPDDGVLPGVFGNIGSHLNFAHCMLHNYVKDGGQMNIGMCNKIRPIWPPYLEKRYNESKNVLLVAEDLDRKEIDHERIQYYLKPYRRIRAVVTYRRLHSWLPSWYNQIVDLYTPNYIQGRERYPSFVEWIDEKYDHFINIHAFAVAERYRATGKYESVEIMNIHGGVPLLEDLFCNFVPSANATCQAIKDGAQPKKQNQGGAHEWERLATHAFLRRKIKTYHTQIAGSVAGRISLAAVKHGIFTNENAYPAICLNQTFLDRLLQTEMEQEKKYFPEWYEKQGGDEALRKDFEKSLPKLCAMDVERILSTGILDPVFEEING